MSVWTDIENTLTEVDEALKGVIHEKCIVGAGTDLEIKIPAVMVNIEEEFANSDSPAFVINPLDLPLDLSRQCQERQVLDEPSQPAYKRVKMPKQAYKVGYVVTGYTSHMRIFKSMQWFMATLFPALQAYILVDGEKLRIELKTQIPNVDYSEQEFSCQYTYEVWVLLDVDDGELVRVPDNVVIKFVNKERKAVVDTEETFTWSE